MEILFLLAGIVIGALLAFLWLKFQGGNQDIELRQQFSALEQERSALTERTRQLTAHAEQLKAELEQQRQREVQLSAGLASEKAGNEHLRSLLENQKAELEGLQQRFTKEFENLANRILEEKSLKFTEQNKSNLDLVLNPLREKIKDFEEKVETAYKAEAAERNSLKGEIKSLVELNRQISEEASNLAKALKGDTKKQGNWGELILEKILERSGLERDKEFQTQASVMDENGKRIQPDVVINLPDEKHIIIDSKVSLVAYEALVNSDTEDDKSRFLKEHLLSVRNHIKGLSEKNYQASPDLTSPDFVLLFMPIESAFSMAIQADQDLYAFAWDRKIVIVSPTTLLATLRTIASIWKQEKQTRNALEIARQGGALYDKFKNFVDDLLDVGKKMDAAKLSYADAMNKLSSGSGNILTRIESLKKLGAKTTKEMPPALVERAGEDI